MRTLLFDVCYGWELNQNFRYDQAAQKFKSIFWIDPSTSVHYIPGNNDVGYVQYEHGYFLIIAHAIITSLDWVMFPQLLRPFRDTMNKRLVHSISASSFQTILSLGSTRRDWSMKTTNATLNTLASMIGNQIPMVPSPSLRRLRNVSRRVCDVRYLMC